MPRTSKKTKKKVGRPAGSRNKLKVESGNTQTPDTKIEYHPVETKKKTCNGTNKMNIFMQPAKQKYSIFHCTDEVLKDDGKIVDWQQRKYVGFVNASSLPEALSLCDTTNPSNQEYLFYGIRSITPGDMLLVGDEFHVLEEDYTFRFVCTLHSEN